MPETRAIPEFILDDSVNGLGTVHKDCAELPPDLVALLALDGDREARAFIEVELAKGDWGG